MVVEWLKNNTVAGTKVSHVHDRYPPRVLTAVAGERFSSRKISVSEQRATIVAFVYRDPAESLLSRISRNHCEHVQGKFCELYEGDRSNSTEVYLHRGADDLMFGAHWEAYHSTPLKYSVVSFDSSDLWDEDTLRCIAKRLKLDPDITAPVYLPNGDQYHADSVPKQLVALRQLYQNLSATINEFRTQHPLCETSAYTKMQAQLRFTPIDSDMLR